MTFLWEKKENLELLWGIVLKKECDKGEKEKKQQKQECLRVMLQQIRRD